METETTVTVYTMSPNYPSLQYALWYRVWEATDPKPFKKNGGIRPDLKFTEVAYGIEDEIRPLRSCPYKNSYAKLEIEHPGMVFLDLDEVKVQIEYRKNQIPREYAKYLHMKALRARCAELKVKYGIDDIAARIPGANIVEDQYLYHYQPLQTDQLHHEFTMPSDIQQIGYMAGILTHEFAVVDGRDPRDIPSVHLGVMRVVGNGSEEDFEMLEFQFQESQKLLSKLADFLDENREVLERLFPRVFEDFRS